MVKMGRTNFRIRTPEAMRAFEPLRAAADQKTGMVPISLIRELSEEEHKLIEGFVQKRGQGYKIPTMLLDLPLDTKPAKGAKTRAPTR